MVCTCKFHLTLTFCFITIMVMVISMCWSLHVPDCNKRFSSVSKQSIIFNNQRAYDAVSVKQYQRLKQHAVFLWTVWMLRLWECECMWFVCLARGNGTGNGIVSKFDRCMVLFTVCVQHIRLEWIRFIELKSKSKWINRMIWRMQLLKH